MDIERPQRLQEIIPIGPPAIYNLTNDKKAAIRTSALLTEIEIRDVDIRIFRKCQIKKEIYTSEIYNRQKVRHNKHIFWNDCCMFETIKCFVLIENRLFAIVRQLMISHDKRREIQQTETTVKLNNVIMPVSESRYNHLIPVESIEGKCLRVLDYVCLFPNNFEIK